MVSSVGRPLSFHSKINRPFPSCLLLRSYEDLFDLHENQLLVETQFQMNSFT